MKKMSKSDPDAKSRIDLSDSPDVIAQKIKKSVTDSDPSITYDPTNRPGVSNLITLSFTIYSVVLILYSESRNFKY